jgi:hypothetical protein
VKKIESLAEILKDCFPMINTADTKTKEPLAHHGPNSGLAKTNKASEREMSCHTSSAPFVLPHYTRIVVPQFQDILVEMCHEVEVSSPSFINSLVA